MPEIDLPPQLPRQLFDLHENTFTQQQRESIQPTKGNLLYLLHCYVHDIKPNSTEQGTFSLSTFCQNSALPTREQTGWLLSLAWRMRSMPQYNWLKSHNFEKDELPYFGDDLDFTDGTAFVFISSNSLSAWLFLLPPVFGGLPITQRQINSLLEEKRVVYGVDYPRIANACKTGEYLSLMQIARAMPPTHGTDGGIHDHFKRTTEIEYAVREDGSIDYHELGWLQTVKADQLICETTPPTPAASGINILGGTIPARTGKKAALPAGVGTYASEDGTKLFAKIDGVVGFASQRFNVDELLVIHGDVDNSVGNLDVLGNLMVRGSVKDGYTIKATGDITVTEAIGAAIVAAGGNLRVGLGVSGHKDCNITAKGDIHSPFLEYATVQAAGNIYCDYIVGSTVTANNSVYATHGRASIIGGSIYAKLCIEAQTIGTPTGRNMEIILGVTAEFLAEKKELDDKIDECNRELDTKQKNLRFLLTSGSMRTEEDKLAIGDIKTSIAFIKRNLKSAEDDLARLLETLGDLSGCTLKAEVVNPPAKLTIGISEMDIKRVYNHVQFRHASGNISVQNTARTLFE